MSRVQYFLCIFVVFCIICSELVVSSKVVHRVSKRDATNLVDNTKSVKNLSRHRRFLVPASSGWSLNFRFLINIPIQDVGSTLTAFVPFTYLFDTGTVTGRRSFPNDDDRVGVLKTIESYVTRFSGLNGHACVLRAICEATEIPLHSDGMIGHLINALLIPANLLDKFYKTHNDYIEAQHDGQFEGDCSRYTQDCPTSIFQVVDPSDNSFNNVGHWQQYDNFTNFNYI